MSSPTSTVAHPSGSAVGVRDPAFVVELETFSGPLDLLLHLIRRDEIEITDIPIARIADQFLAAIHELGLNQAADYLEMAARLLRIKAQMLLPRRYSADDWEDPRYELVRRLLEYEQIREAADWLAGRSQERAERFSRGFIPEPPPAPAPPLQVELADLVDAVDQLLASLPEPILHRVVPHPLDVEGATAHLEELLVHHDRLSWSDLVGRHPTLVDALSMLVALLELARMRKLLVTQPAPFEPLTVIRAAADPPR